MKNAKIPSIPQVTLGFWSSETPPFSLASWPDFHVGSTHKQGFGLEASKDITHHIVSYRKLKCTHSLFILRSEFNDLDNLNNKGSGGM